MLVFKFIIYDMMLCQLYVLDCSFTGAPNCFQFIYAHSEMSRSRGRGIQKVIIRSMHKTYITDSFLTSGKDHSELLRPRDRGVQKIIS